MLMIKGQIKEILESNNIPTIDIFIEEHDNYIDITLDDLSLPIDFITNTLENEIDNKLNIDFDDYKDELDYNRTLEEAKEIFNSLPQEQELVLVDTDNYYIKLEYVDNRIMLDCRLGNHFYSRYEEMTNDFNLIPYIQIAKRINKYGKF